MKSLVKLLCGIFVLMIVFSSCQKEISADDFDPIDPPAANDSIYLNKAYFLTDLGTGMDTVVTATLQYDSRKRIVSWTDSTTADNNDEPYTISYQYFYNGNDTVPYKVISLWDDLLTADDYDSTIAFFTYDANGRKLKDSVVYHEYSGGAGSSSLQLTNYTYAAGKMYGETKTETLTPSSFIEMRRDSATLNAAGDIVQNKSYLLDGGSYELAETMNLTYDTKISPFTYLTSYAAHKSFPYQMLELFDHVAKANILTENSTTILPNPGTFTRTSTYQYNNRQLPVKVTSIVNQGTPDQENFQVIFTYKKL